MPSTQKPLIRIGIVTIFFIGAAFVLRLGFPTFYIPVFPVLILFFLIIYLGFVFLLLRKEENHPPHFINRFLLLTGIKFFLIFFFILFYLIIFNTNSSLFLIYALILYTGYSLVTYSSILSKWKEK